MRCRRSRLPTGRKCRRSTSMKSAAHYFERNGVSAILVDPRALEYRGGHLWAGDYRVDIIYKRVLISEMIQRMGVDNPIVQRGARPRRDDDQFLQRQADGEEGQLRLSERRAQRPSVHAGAASRDSRAHPLDAASSASARRSIRVKTVDLLEFITERRDQFVLKPNDEYGGKGVILGWECLAGGMERDAAAGADDALRRAGARVERHARFPVDDRRTAGHQPALRRCRSLRLLRQNGLRLHDAALVGVAAQRHGGRRIGRADVFTGSKIALKEIL